MPRLNNACAAANSSLITTLKLMPVTQTSKLLYIHHACINEHYGITKLLIDNNASLNKRDADGLLPVHYAYDTKRCDIISLVLVHSTDASNPKDRLLIYSEFEHFDTVSSLTTLIENLDVNELDVYGKTPLHYACKNEKIGFEAVQVLLAKGAQMGIVDSYGRIPLHYACENKVYGYRIVKSLTDQSDMIDVPDSDQKTALHVACQENDSNTVNELIIKGANVEARDVKERRPVHYACQNKRSSHRVLQILTEKGADVNAKDVEGQTPLHIACSESTELTVEVLIDKGAEIAVEDSKGIKPVIYACENKTKSYQILEVLVKNKVEVGVVDQNLQTPLHIACARNNKQLVELLVSRGAPIDSTDDKKRMPVHYACQNQKHGLTIVEFLFEKGADLNVIDYKNQTPLHIACLDNNHRLLDFLVLNGAQIDVQDVYNRVPLHYASMNNDFGMSIAYILLNEGAQVMVVDCEDHTPIQYAYENDNKDLVELLIQNCSVFDNSDVRLSFDNSY